MKRQRGEGDRGENVRKRKEAPADESETASRMDVEDGEGGEVGAVSTKIEDRYVRQVIMGVDVTEVYSPERE